MKNKQEHWNERHDKSEELAQSVGSLIFFAVTATVTAALRLPAKIFPAASFSWHVFSCKLRADGAGGRGPQVREEATLPVVAMTCVCARARKGREGLGGGGGQVAKC
jgi:hypothetical protein